MLGLRTRMQVDAFLKQAGVDYIIPMDRTRSCTISRPMIGYSNNAIVNLVMLVEPA
jgi:hypothetical protein